MILGSLLLILIAVAMLGLGLVRGTNAFLVGSIAASLLAAIALVIGARQVADARGIGGTDPYDDDEPDADDRRAAYPAEPAEVPAGRGRKQARRSNEAGTVYGRDRATTTGGTDTAVIDEVPPDGEDEQHGRVPSQGTGQDDLIEAAAGSPGEVEVDPGSAADDLEDEDEPADEPPVQVVSPIDAERLVRLDTDVLVIDGRPRYHRADCVHLLGRDSEPLPVSEAIELGFTPCSLCDPVTTLLADVRRS